MRLLADENVDRPVVLRLRDEGHEVVYVVELAPSVPDAELLRHFGSEPGLLLTADKDFAETVFRQGRVTTGIVLIRLSGLSPAHKAAIVAAALREHAEELRGSFVVITPGGVRIRKPLAG